MQKIVAVFIMNFVQVVCCKVGLCKRNCETAGYIIQNIPLAVIKQVNNINIYCMNNFLLSCTSPLLTLSFVEGKIKVLDFVHAAVLLEQ